MNGPAVSFFERLLPRLLAGSVAVILLAIAAYAGEFPWYWGAANGTDVLLWIASCLLLAALLRRGAREQALPLFGAALLLYLATGVGLQESATVLLFFTACYLYGRIVLALIFSAGVSAASGLSRPLLIGLAIQLTCFGLLIHVPLNTATGYLAIQLAPVLLLAATGQLPAWSRLGVSALGARVQVLNSIPYWYCVALLILVGMTARYAFFPTLSADDNAVHLRMWTELTMNAQYSFDVIAQIWAASPFALDLMHSIVSLITGADARGALNLALLALLLRQLWAILAHFGSAVPDRLLLLVLFVSTPLAAFLLVTLQTELLLAVLATSGVRLVLEAPRNWYGANTLAVLCVAALCCAVKLPGIILGLLLLSALLVQLWPLRRAELARHSTASKLLFAGAVGALGVLALNAYVTAWQITGNPVFPLYNGIFRSPYFDASNFSDDRWLPGASFASYWNLFFNTDEHYESGKFVAGFQYLFLLPLALPLLWRRASAQTAWAVLLPLLGFGLVMFSVTQYWRYMFPVFPLATAVMGFLLPGNSTAPPCPYPRAARATIGACLLLNFWFYPGISYMFDTPPSASDTDTERTLLAGHYVPAQVLGRLVSRIAPGSRVLYHPESPAGASLVGEPIYLAWYAPTYLGKALGIRDDADVGRFLEELDIDYVIWNMDMLNVPGQAQWLLKDYLSRFGEPMRQVSNHVLFRLQQTPRTYREVFRASGLQITSAPLLAGGFATGGAAVARFSLSFHCTSPTGVLLAELLWSDGSRWQRLIQCGDQSLVFSEALLVPPGITSADLQLSGQDTAAASVSSLTLEID